MLRESFSDIMDIETVSLDGKTMAEQITAVQRATILMGVSSSATHNGMSLRNGTVLVDIVPRHLQHGQLLSEYWVNWHLCNANSPQTILCHPIFAPTTANMTDAEIYESDDVFGMRNLPLKADLKAFRLQFESILLIYGLNEILINRMISEAEPPTIVTLSRRFWHPAYAKKEQNLEEPKSPQAQLKLIFTAITELAKMSEDAQVMVGATTSQLLPQKSATST
ncbi:hypothetical protein BDK51DRAFT_34527 [Blyttiomyces helicus]|uniref:Uncharacterized protein n=1 Tax=Blyttiomyces helicus TaxID=388810 RepID=A0A4P9WBJ3_9FUNG|nr:hypothetical protein BDK51DRAFT_34527 [Blyttiomyces helicus]|eukprot:RKO88923.1 hypothetical protein BDK51DRAFT_34527 [Blyttiomyces helicus]